MQQEEFKKNDVPLEQERQLPSQLQEILQEANEHRKILNDDHTHEADFIINSMIQDMLNSICFNDSDYMKRRCIEDFECEKQAKKPRHV
ncbi:unnamed protein product [Rotaria magnacalcarata]|uniref:Uncharacterized protein n=1 Tax=Rotaria magnacalcarata TaxID=392030 RepID=A0A814V654_9BILA|nr:unnamed protein product [Rotaria magnacalcarata]CAF3991484.1 unnamed protein product [Rotaria magnacalcarata]